ncbi:type II secretion system inner membrane protein GspF [Hellea balneolensis]|uniref:type II secretion system inner membrane protein GspF n=1 Tax=Hellea balneolensis TaxID=287478 RepID=UPI0004239EF4|nr:type II secretion system inner membrane protein GspF [Hellea balneolensis]
MEAFDYAALDAGGKRKKGTVMASSARDARDILRARALMPLELAPSKSKKKQETGGTASGVKHKHLTQATRQLAILIDAATPIEEALKITALQFERSPMKAALLSIRAQVMEGLRLSDALRGQPRVFPPLYTAMVASGETSGRLPAVLERLADDLEAAQKIRRKIMGATAYPVVLSIVALLVVVILMIAVVPKVVDQFDSFGQDLPTLTNIVIALSAWMQKWGLVTLGVFVIAIFALRQALKAKAFRYRWDGMMLGLPLLGKIIRNMNAARFARTMAGLVDSDTPALVALETAQHTLQNSVMRDAVSEAAVKVREGSAMSTALRGTAVFPPLVVQMVAGGEASGDMGKMFAKSAEYLEDEFDSSTTVFLTLLEPLIIIFLAGIVLLIIAAIFLPILQLNTLAF